MPDQQDASVAEDRHWPRFRLRTLILAVGILSLILSALSVSIPRLLWRHHVAQALEAAQTAGPEPRWSFNAPDAPRRGDFNDARRFGYNLAKAV